MNASPLEWTWTVIAIVGFLFTVWMILDAVADYETVKESIRRNMARPRGPRWWVALGACVTNTLMAFVWMGFVAVGVLAMQYPSPPPNPNTPLPGLVAGWVLLFMEGVLAAIQIWSRVVRVKVMGKARVPARSAKGSPA